MKNYNLDNTIDACDLDNVLVEGDNISIVKLDDCQLQISSTGGGSIGIKYHLKNGDSITVKDCFQYSIDYNFIIDEGAKFTINEGAQLVIKDGYVLNCGTICNDGQIFNL